MDFFLSPDRFTLRCRPETRERNWREKASYPTPGSGLLNGPSLRKISGISQEIYSRSRGTNFGGTRFTRRRVRPLSFESAPRRCAGSAPVRSEEHTSEL